jgi:hypothetical protein
VSQTAPQLHSEEGEQTYLRANQQGGVEFEDGRVEGFFYAQTSSQQQKPPQYIRHCAEHQSQ